jgi:hypothetical protein
VSDGACVDASERQRRRLRSSAGAMCRGWSIGADGMKEDTVEVGNGLWNVGRLKNLGGQSRCRSCDWWQRTASEVVLPMGEKWTTSWSSWEDQQAASVAVLH